MKRFFILAIVFSLSACSTSSDQRAQDQPPQDQSPAKAEIGPAESEELTSNRDHVYVTMGADALHCGKSATETGSTDLDACIVDDTEVVELLIDTDDAWQRVVDAVAKLAQKTERVTLTDSRERTTLLSTTTHDDLQGRVVVHYDDRGVKAACLTREEPDFYPADLPAVNVETPIIAEALDGVPCDGAEWIGVYCEGTLEADGCMRVLEAASEAYPQPIVLIDSNPS